MATRKSTKTSKRTPRQSPRPRAKSAARKPATPHRARSPRDEGTRLRSVAPGFTVNDIEKSLTWYRDVLGFAVNERWEHDGSLAGVEMSAGSVVFMLGQDDWKKGRDRVKGEGFRMYCTTAERVDRLAERIKARGWPLLQEPRDQPWGMRDFAVADPDGFKITIATKTKR